MAWTKLDVVNDALGTMGELPINSLPTKHPYGSVAANMLARVCADMQRGGYWFNTERLRLVPSQIGELYVPNDAVACWPVGAESGQWTQRGNRMYHLNKQTYLTNTALDVIIVRALDFEVLPSVMQEVVAWETIRRFCLNYDADTQKVQQAIASLNAAKMSLNAETTRNAKVNLFNASTADFRAGNRLRVRRT